MSTKTLRAIRKWISLVGIVSIISSLLVVSPIANAYAGKDAPAWATAAVDEACDRSLIDCSLASPGFTSIVDRAVGYQMLTSGYQVLNESAKSPFTDSVGQWYEAAASTAYTLGWTSGIDGQFKGSNNLTRAMMSVAVAQVLGLEADDETALDVYTDKGDIPNWARASMAAMVEAKLIGQGGPKTIRPNASITKIEGIVVLNASVTKAEDDEIDVLTIAADRLGVDADTVQEALDTGMNVVDGVLVVVGEDDPTDPTDPTDPVDPVDPPVTPAGSLAVALAGDNPTGSAPLADGTAGNVLTKLAMSCSADVNITGLKIKKGGISADSAVSGVYVNDSAGMRHGNVVTFSENIADVQFSSNPIVCKKGSPAMVSLLANIAATAGSGTVQFSVTASTDVSSNATGVTGSFPLAGASHTTVDGSSSVGTLTVDSATISTATRNVNVGTSNQDVGKFTFAAGSNEHVLISKIVLLNNGNAGDGDFQNIKVLDPKGVTLCTVEKSVSKIVICDMSAAPYKLEKGLTATFRVVVDVKGGSTRTVQFRIQNDYDIYASGDSTKAGVLAVAVSAGVTSASQEESFPIGDGPVAGSGDNSGALATSFNSLTFGAGTLLVSKDSTSPAGNVSQGGKQVKVGSWKLEATGEDMEIQRVCFDLDNGAVAAFTEADLTGTIRVRRMSTQSAVYSVTPVAAHVDGVCDQVTLSSYFTIKAGTSEVIELVVDYASTAGPAGTSHTAEFGSVYYKRLDTNDFITAAGTEIASNALTIQVASLTPTSNPSFSNQNMVRGGGSSKIGSVQLQAGSAEDISIQTMLISLDNDTAETLGDDDTLTGISNLKLMKGGLMIGTAVASPSGSASGNSFTVSGQLDVKASTTDTVDIYADLATNADTTIRPFIPAAGITFVGSSSNTSSTTPTAATALQVITTQASGTLNVTAPIQSTQRIIHASETATELLSFKLEAVSEVVNVDKLILTAINGGSNLVNLKLTDASGVTVYRSGVSLVNNTATFSGLVLSVPKDTVSTYKVWGDSSASGVMVSAVNTEIRLGAIDARGANSGASIVETSVTTEASSTTSRGHWAANSIGVFSDGAVTPDTFGIVTALVEEDTDITAAGALLKDGTAANLTVAATINVTKLSTSAIRTTTVVAATGTDTFAAGDVVFLNDVDSAANSGLVVVASFTNNGGTAGLDNADALNIRPLETADGTGTAYTAATGDVVVRFAAARGSSFEETDVTDGLGFATVVGDVCFWGDTTAANSNFFVAQQVLAANADVSAANAVSNGVDLDNTDSIACYTSLSNEEPSTVSTYSYNIGEVVAVTDASTPANNGFHVVQTAVPSGSTLVGAAVPFTGITLVGAAGNNATDDMLAKFFISPLTSNVNVVHDVEPVITRSATAITTTVGQTLQDAAIFDITASGPRNLSISAMSIYCAGAGAANTEFPDNAIEIKVDGALQASSAEDSATCATGNGRAHTFNTPIEIQAGTTKSFLVRMDTSATAGQWSTGESVLMRIAGTAGKTAGGLSWFYVAAAPSPGTEPTLASPATITDSYPVDGPTLTF